MGGDNDRALRVVSVAFHKVKLCRASKFLSFYTSLVRWVGPTWSSPRDRGEEQAWRLWDCSEFRSRWWRAGLGHLVAAPEEAEATGVALALRSDPCFSASKRAHTVCFKSSTDEEFLF